MTNVEVLLNDSSQLTPEESIRRNKPDLSNSNHYLKVYVYDLPPNLNKDILAQYVKLDLLSHCYDLSNFGVGREVGKISCLDCINGQNVKFMQDTYEISLRNTHMFSLEIIMHFKLLNSPYRTLNPLNADLFYVPFYGGLLSMYLVTKARFMDISETCQQHIDELYRCLSTMSFFKDGKPHFSTFGRIQAELEGARCPLLKHPYSTNITFIGIEKRSATSQSIIVAPYPSYIHFNNTHKDRTLMESTSKLGNLLDTEFRLRVPPVDNRNVLVFIAGGRRRGSLRDKLIDQVSAKTNENYEAFFRKTNATFVSQMWLQTTACNLQSPFTTEKSEDSTTNLSKGKEWLKWNSQTNQPYKVVSWMLRSVFCLQPPGDSPTRKSFYDSILCGCIPVIFNSNRKTVYPFDDLIDYSEFTVSIDAKLISDQNKSIISLLKNIPKDKVIHLHNNILRMAKWFQYSVSPSSNTDDDAFSLILHQLNIMHKT